MYEYEMDSTRTVGATERRWDGGWTDRWTDGWREWNQYTPQQFAGYGGGVGRWGRGRGRGETDNDIATHKSFMSY